MSEYTMQYLTDQVKIFKFCLLIFLAYGCGKYEGIPQNTIGWDTLQNARRIIYVSSNGSNKANGSRAMPLASIQKAINIAQPGDVVKVEPGTYTENIRLRPRVSLVGSGSDTTTLTSDNENIITAYNVYGVVIEGFTLDGKDKAKYGLFGNCEEVQRRNSNKAPTMIAFRKNVVKNFVDSGIYGLYVNITIQDNSFISIVGYGIHLDRSFSNIKNNWISLVDTGIFLADYGGSIEDNTIENICADGIYCHNLERAMIKHNKIINSGQNGIKCEVTSPIVRSNYVAGSLTNGISCYGISGPKIRENVITKNRL